VVDQVFAHPGKVSWGTAKNTSWKLE